ncbi:MAG: hypothetical protein QOI41_3374, partial [Myxococcales bacterium]|nr:hypothetical protein [Myxococcales bacterium]
QHPDFRTAYDAWEKKDPCVFEGASGPFIASATPPAPAQV